MSRSALVLITALVLAAHWLVLGSLPLSWQSAAFQPPVTFSTRSIAPPPATAGPPPLPAATPAPSPAPTAVPAQAATPSPPPRPPKAPRPRRSVSEAPSAPAGIAAAEGEAESETAPPATEDAPPPAAPAALADASPVDPDPASEPVATAPAPPPPDPTVSSDARTDAGVDIRAPGGGPGHASSTAAPPVRVPAPPVRVPAPTRLEFDVSGQAKKFAYSASAELLWQHDGSRYEARQEISAFLLGKRSQRSTGQITAQGLQPERFSDRSRSEQAAHFDQANGRVTFSANTPEAAIGAGAQDRLSVFIQLGALLAADPGRFVPRTEITLATVSARSADRWTFTIEGPETLALPAGTMPALKLQRLPRKEYDQKAELWVAPGLGYLPVRIRITQANGDFADLLLRSSGAP